MKLQILNNRFAVCRLPPDAAFDLPATSSFFTVSRTNDELSIVCEEILAPDNADIEPGWRCLRVAGQLAFETVGLLASLTKPLADAEISVFAVSTFDTDYLMWKEENTDRVIDVLSQKRILVRLSGQSHWFARLTLHPTHRTLTSFSAM